jgi:uncharacterized protein YqeY
LRSTRLAYPIPPAPRATSPSAVRVSGDTSASLARYAARPQSPDHPIGAKRSDNTAYRLGDCSMSALKETLRRDLTAAIRSRDAVVAATLRMALTAVTTEEVAGKVHRELSDEEVSRVLTKEAKKRREAATAYTAAGRPELAATEEAELAVLAGYLPQQLTEAEIATLVAEAVASTGASGMPQLGHVMKALQPRVAGRADGAAVAAAVRAALSR